MSDTERTSYRTDINNTDLLDDILTDFVHRHPKTAAGVAKRLRQGKGPNQMASSIKLYMIDRGYSHIEGEVLATCVLLLGLHLKAHPELIEQYESIPAEMAAYREAHQE